MLTFLLRYWKPLAGVAAVLVLLMSWRIAMNRAEQRGYDRCQAQEREDRQRWRDTYDQRRADIAKRDDANRNQYNQTAAPIRERIIVEAAKPGACRLYPDAERLLGAQREAANRAIAAASGGAMPSAAASPEGDAAIGSRKPTD